MILRLISTHAFALKTLPAALRAVALALMVSAPGTAAALEGSPSQDSDVAWRELLADPVFLVAASAHSGLQLPLHQTRVFAADGHESRDPYESINRHAHEFNTLLRRHLLEPIAQEYMYRTSQPVQQGVSNIFANLREPVTIASNLLLGDTASAGTATARFLINTTAGLGGYYDPATGRGYPHRPRSLEEVLCRYSIPDGPYLVLPILGPATLRDAAGRLTTLVVLYFALGPIYIPYRITDIAVQYVDLRDQLRHIDSMSIDPYASQQSAHLQTHKLACEQQTEAQSQLFGQ